MLFRICSNFLLPIMVCETEIFIEIFKYSYPYVICSVESRIMHFGLVHFNCPVTVRHSPITVRRRITTDSPKLKTVVGSGAGICCGKMSCGYCHQSMDCIG